MRIPRRHFSKDLLVGPRRKFSFDDDVILATEGGREDWCRLCQRREEHVNAEITKFQGSQLVKERPNYHRESCVSADAAVCEKEERLHVALICSGQATYGVQERRTRSSI